MKDFKTPFVIGRKSRWNISKTINDLNNQIKCVRQGYIILKYNNNNPRISAVWTHIVFNTNNTVRITLCVPHNLAISFLDM